MLNGARLVAYVPQIMCVYRDRSGASSVSMMTWAMFFSANLATVFYALATIGDPIIAGVFAANAVACMAIFALILKRRMTHAWRDERAHGSGLALRGFWQSWSAATLSSSRDRMEDRIAARHIGEQWSDATERRINQSWQDYRCSRYY
jgi:hypothetical protein